MIISDDFVLCKIVGGVFLFQLGEITFFSLYDGKELAFISMRGCVDQLLLAKRADHTTHLLVSLIS